MKHGVLLISFCMLVLGTSCNIIKPKDQYGDLPQSWKDIVVPLGDFDHAKRSEITKINGIQLQDELKKHPKALVRFVVNYCPANQDLKSFEDYSIENGYRLFIVMYDFRMPYMIFNQPINSPVFAIDTPHYNTENTNKSSKRFINEMLGKAIDEKVDIESFYVFNQGIYVPEGSKLIDKELNSVQK